jgi:hypothetical protein
MKAFWSCTIGPVDRADLSKKPPLATDATLRRPVENAFEAVFGTDYTCSSGWEDEDKVRSAVLERRIVRLCDAMSEAIKALGPALPSTPPEVVHASTVLVAAYLEDAPVINREPKVTP